MSAEPTNSVKSPPAWPAVMKKVWAYGTTIGLVAIVSTAAAIIIGSISVLHEPVYINDVVVRGVKDVDSSLGKELAARVKDKVEAIYRSAAIDTHRWQDIATGAPTPPALKLDKSFISVDDVQSFAHLLPGYEKKIIDISVDLNPDPGAKGSLYYGLITPYHLIVRSSFAASESSSETVGSIDQIIDQAAIDVIKLLDLPVAANFIRSAGPASLVEASYLAQRGADESKGDLKARALMILGFIQGAEKRIEDADESFRKAGELKGTPLGRAASLDGQAYIRINDSASDQDLSDANDLLEKARKESSEYDSAQFHRAEIKRYIAEKKLKLHGCAAEPDFEAASAEYKKLTKDLNKEGFAVAYDSEATMWLQLESYMQFSSNSRNTCPGITEENMDKIFAVSDALFEKALQYEPNYGPTWLQWANLADEYRKLHFTANKQTKKVEANGIEAVDTAIYRYSRAVKLSESDGIALRRLMDSIEVYPVDSVSESPDPSVRNLYVLPGVSVFDLVQQGRQGLRY